MQSSSGTPENADGRSGGEIGRRARELRVCSRKSWWGAVMLSELSLIRGELAQGSGRSCFTCSFQAEDVVVLHLLRQVQADIPVLFLDTGYHFPALLEYRGHL